MNEWKFSGCEWLGHSLTVFGVDDSSLLKVAQRCDDLNSYLALLIDSLGGIKVGHL